MIMGREVKKVPEEETDENGKPVLNVVTLQLDEKHQGRIRTRGTMRHFAIDFEEEKIRSYMTILLSTPTPKGEPPTVAMYVSYKQVPNQHTFDVRLTGPAEIMLSPTDPRFRFGRIYLTVLSLRVEAQFRLLCRRVPIREKAIGKHEHFATDVISKSMRRYTHASNHALRLVRTGPQGRLLQDIFTSGPDVNKESAAKAAVFEQELSESVMETFSMQSRTITVRDSAFNPTKLRDAVAQIHSKCSKSSTNHEKHAAGKHDAREITNEFIRAILNKTVTITDPVAVLRAGQKKELPEQTPGQRAESLLAMPAVVEMTEKQKRAKERARRDARLVSSTFAVPQLLRCDDAPHGEMRPSLPPALTLLPAHNRQPRRAQTPPRTDRTTSARPTSASLCCRPRESCRTRRSRSCAWTRPTSARTRGTRRASASSPPPRPLPRTNRTSLVPHLLLIGHALVGPGALPLREQRDRCVARRRALRRPAVEAGGGPRGALGRGGGRAA